MALRIIGLIMAIAFVTAAFEILVRRNRQERRKRTDLLSRGVEVIGTVTALERVRVGKYGTTKAHATFTYDMGGRSYTSSQMWWDFEGAPTTIGATVPLRADPNDPASTILAATTPPIESDRLLRTMEIVLVLVLVATFFIFL